MTSLVALPKLVAKGVHWSSRNPDILERSDGSIFCELFRSGEHTVFEPKSYEALSKTEIRDNEAFSLSSGVDKSPNSSLRRCKTFTKLQLHRILGHPSPQVIEHVAKSARDNNINVIEGKSPRTIECQTCALSKSHEIVSRLSQKEHPASEPFERITIDLIPMRECYNSNTQIIYFQCSKILLNMIFTLCKKSEASKVVIKVLNLVSSMGYKARFLHLDDESSLQGKLNDISYEYGLKLERSALYTPSQNGQSEVNGRWIIMKARAFVIEANLPSNLWPNLVVTVGYLMNRTPTKKLSWKTPFECVYGYKPLLSHLDILGSKVYALKRNIPKLDKLLSRAHIGYLVGWE